MFKFRDIKLKNIIFYVFILTTFLGLLIGSYFTISYIVENFSTCIIEEYSNRVCYESRTNIILEQYFKIDGNRTAFFLCGPVLNCLTGPCSENMLIGISYPCRLYSNKLYQIYSSQNHDRAGFIIILAIILCLSSLAIFIYICDDVRIYMAQIYKKVDNSEEDIKISNFK